ncbi:Transcription factor of morphogenesis MCM1 [Zancudomyces culisetae]|uniref:Transcription factor of morphogenesis MCM1 n=1 Tax=Zancudomyces culisetae TaxID=1213189 RepID=A0A1R1PTY4_ZANCU|nr:Transcription factor of morphogenesis MCM1 [Zancudomyces culisetae]|eukprot:OMH84456.1 Transcription factor of morphogenesis MCM1 [Zancudomyces culisetae]
MDVSGINSGTAGQFDLNVNTELKTPDGEYKYDIGDNSAGAYNFGSSSQALNVQEDKAEKKAYELSKLTGTQILLLIVSESGLIYTFSTPKLQPVISTDEGKALIHRSISGSNDGNSCLDSTEVIKNEYLYCDSTAGPAVKNFSDITSLGLGVARENNNGYSSYTRYVVGNIGTNQYLTTMGNTEDLTLGKRSYQEYQNESNMTHPYHNRSEPQHSMTA